MVGVLALWTVQLLVASALLAKVLATLNKHDGESTCKQWEDDDKTGYKCSHIMGGTVSFTLKNSQ